MFSNWLISILWIYYNHQTVIRSGHCPVGSAASVNHKRITTTLIMYLQLIPFYGAVCSVEWAWFKLVSSTLIMLHQIALRRVSCILNCTKDEVKLARGATSSCGPEGHQTSCILYCRNVYIIIQWKYQILKIFSECNCSKEMRAFWYFLDWVVFAFPTPALDTERSYQPRHICHISQNFSR